MSIRTPARQKGCRMPFEVCRDYDGAKAGPCDSRQMTPEEREKYKADEVTLYKQVKQMLAEGIDVGTIAQVVGLGKNIIINIKRPHRCWKGADK